MLKYRCVFFAPTTFGLRNETLDGVFGAVFNGTADVGVTAAGISVARSKFFTMLDSQLPRTYMVVVHARNLISAKDADLASLAIHKLISKGVLIGLGAALFGLSVVGIILDRCEGAMRGQRLSFAHLCNTWIIKMLGMGLGIEGFEDFEATRLRHWSTAKWMLYCSWCLYTLFVLSTISGQLSVVFTFASPQKLPFADVESLLLSNFTVYGTATVVDTLNASKIPFHGELAEKVTKLPFVTEEKDRYLAYVNLTQKPQTALIINQEILLEMSYINCELYVAIDRIGTIKIAGILLPKHSPFRESFERAFAQAMQTGLLSGNFHKYDLYQRVTAQAHQRAGCYGKKVGVQTAIVTQPLSLNTVGFLMNIFCFMLISSCIALGGENVLRIYRNGRCHFDVSPRVTG